MTHEFGYWKDGQYVCNHCDTPQKRDGEDCHSDLGGFSVDIADPGFLKLIYEGHEIFVTVHSQSIEVDLYHRNNEATHDSPNATARLAF